MRVLINSLSHSLSFLRLILPHILHSAVSSSHIIISSHLCHFSLHTISLYLFFSFLHFDRHCLFSARGREREDKFFRFFRGWTSYHCTRIHLNCTRGVKSTFGRFELPLFLFFSSFLLLSPLFSILYILLHLSIALLFFFSFISTQLAGDAFDTHTLSCLLSLRTHWGAVVSPLHHLHEHR